ncbi:MAG: biopolymer transporter ExbD [Prevotellaceae bacterium]|jgi:biopolymer transport protein ExbD|nr:biopolymer transporter ExbD [Prevotellaceae bacterium]
MSKIKQKEHSTFIDMTAMSDVTVLLLTFFMSTATFLPKEPIQVTSPGSVMEIKIPDAFITTILVRPDGKAYVNFDRPNDKRAILERIGKDYNITFTKDQINSFLAQPSIGVPINNTTFPKFLDLPLMEQDEYLKTHGLAVDSTQNETNQLRTWMVLAMNIALEEEKDYAKEYHIAIKADKITPYTNVSPVISTLQDLHLNRFNLITTLEQMPNLLANE